MKKEFAPLLDKSVPVAEKIQALETCRAQAWQAYLDAKLSGHKGLFRTFFAKMYGVSESTIQRLMGLRKLSPDIIAAIDAKRISTTFGERLSSYPEEWQEEVLKAVENGTLRGKVAEVQPFLQERHKELAEEKPQPRIRPRKQAAPIAPLPPQEQGNQKPFDFQYTIKKYPVHQDISSYDAKNWLLMQTKDFYDKLAEYAAYRKKLLLEENALPEAAQWDACLNELKTQSFLISSRFSSQKDADLS